MYKMSTESVLEIHHKREESREYEEWSREERRETGSGEFVTVVAVDSTPNEKAFVTVLSVDPENDTEDVLVYRLPGERLGFGLKFEGGTKTAERVSKLLIQSCAPDSPASRTTASWGPLAPGDEILTVDGSPVSEMTRIDCVRALKESNVVIELRVRKGGKRGAPPVPPRKFPRRKETSDMAEDSPPIPSRRELPQAEVYTDLLAQESLLPAESESDDTGSSISTVVSRLSTTSDSSFSDARSLNSVDLANPAPPTSNAFDLDRVLEPFLRLEREFSSEDIDESSIFTKLVEASSMIEEGAAQVPELPPKPTPRPENREKSRYGKKRPPPPPPPPRSDRQEEHLPRLIDFVPKDRTDLVVPSPLVLHEPQPRPPVPEFHNELYGGKSESREETQGGATTESSGLPPQPKMELANNIETQNGVGGPEKVGFAEALPPSFSRQPPDGHEFPTHYEESVRESKTEIQITTEEHKLFSVSPNGDNVKITRIDKTAEDSLKKVGYKHRGWRNDEKSEKSVKDKIAMFSSASKESCQPPAFVPRKLNRYKSSDDLNSQNENNSQKGSCIRDDLSKPPLPNLIKKGSMSYNSMIDVNAGIEDRKLDTERSEMTQSTIDLTSCAYEDSLSPPQQTGEYSTLPRKFESGRKIVINKPTESRPSLARAVSFNGPSKIHTRSQSLIDVCQKPNSSLSRNSIDDARRSSLNALIEQRRKSMSKLRGLVIPEKVVEVPAPQFIIDLPEIKSKECLLSNNHSGGEKIPAFNNEKTASAATFNTSCLMTTPPWKTEGQIYDLPKYSPAFKRKSLSVFGASSLGSSVSSSLNSSREELRTCFNEVQKASNGLQGTLPRNSIPTLKGSPSQNQTEPKSLESIASPSMSDVGCDCHSPNSKNGSDSSKSPKYREPFLHMNKLNPDVRVTEEESDNDSAVSSSRSSISHGFSPPNSPMPEVQRCERGNIILSRSNSNSSGGRTLKRTLSSETTASTSSNGSTLTSGSQASCSSLCSSLSADSRRVLKPQSVEAINRKNVLSSARFSSGQDLKVGSPPMHVLHQEDDGHKTPESVIMVKLNHNYGDRTISPVLNSHVEFKDTSLTKEQDQHYDEIKPAITDEIVEPRKVDQSHSERRSELDKSPPQHLIEENCLAFEKCMINDDITSCLNEKDVLGSELTSTEIMSSSNSWKDGSIKNIPRNENNLKPSNVNGIASQNEIKNPSIPMKSSVSQKSVSVTDIKKAFEKAEMILAPSGRLRNNTNGNVPIQHPRVSSVDSTNSDDSFARTPTHYGSTSDLQKEQQFGSITSLASSTSLISQQELSQLIEESNQALEEGGCSHEVVVVVLHRDTVGGSVGITLAGGADCEAKEITVHKVLSGSPAERDGRVQKGDRILSINGKSMKGLTHRESLAILKAPRPEVVLVVSRYRLDTQEDIHQRQHRISDHKITSTANTLLIEKGNETRWGPTITVVLTKDGAGLGFSLEGGKDSPFGDQPLTVKKIFTGGCAEKCGQLFAGDELISVNNTDLSGLSRIEAWALMKRLPDGKVHLNIRHPIS